MKNFKILPLKLSCDPLKFLLKFIKNLASHPPQGCLEVSLVQVGRSGTSRSCPAIYDSPDPCAAAADIRE